MNIFVLDTDPVIAAKMQCNKHVVKMILESAQLLSTCHHWHESASDDMYRSTHQNHPCSVWVRQSANNYYWLYQHFLALMDEYTERYGKVHACDRLRSVLAIAPPTMPFLGLTEFPQCMPEEYKQESTVEAYRAYYAGDKAYMAVWPENKMPEWFKTA